MADTIVTGADFNNVTGGFGDASTGGSSASPFVITILDAPLANTPAGKIELLGRALPYKGVQWETEQRGKTTYYPGNPVGTQQKFGPVDKNLIITGQWKMIFLGNDTVPALVDTFDGLCRSGADLEISWGAGKLPDGSTAPRALIRRGFIKRFRHKYDRQQDVEWEIEFELRGRDEATAPPISAAGLISSKNNFDEVTLKFQDAQDAIEIFKDDPLTRLAGLPEYVNQSLEDSFNSLGNMVETIQFASDSLNAVSMIPNTILERTLGALNNGFNALDNLRNTINSLNLVALQTWDSALDFLDLKNRLFGVVESADVGMEAAHNTSIELNSRRNPAIVTEIRPTPDTDLRDLARQYYGDPDLWWIIADFNNLDTSAVPSLPFGPSDSAGPPIRIPQRGQTSQDTVRSGCGGSDA